MASRRQSIHELVAEAPANASVERARRDFPSLLHVADVSVSQAGYNTVIDILATGARAVLVPFEEGGEKEQRMRAEHLAAQGRAVVVTQAELGPATLMAAIDEVMSLPQPGSAATIMLDGAGVAAKKIAGAAARAFAVARRLAEAARGARGDRERTARPSRSGGATMMWSRPRRRSIGCWR